MVHTLTHVSHMLPAIGIIYLDLVVARSSGEQWLGRVEGDGADRLGMVGEGLGQRPGAEVVDVDLFAARSGGEQWLGPVEGDGEDVIGMVGEGFLGEVDIYLR